MTIIDRSSPVRCDPGIIKPALLQSLKGPGPHQLLNGLMELILYEGQYLLHWLDNYGEDQFKFVSEDAVQRAFSEQEMSSGWLPSNIQQWGMSARGNWMIRWIPATRHTITLVGPSMPEGPITLPLPALLFAGQGNEYYVWATDGEAFAPTLPLYEAPLPNVYTGKGSICFGDNGAPEVACNTFQAAWELFITSPFNDHLSGGKSRRQKHDIRQQLTAVRKKAHYPISDLIPLTESYSDKQLTVQDVVDRRFLKVS